MEEKRKKNLNQSPIALINKIAFDKMEWKQEVWWNYRTRKKTDRSILATRVAILKKKKRKETSSCRVERATNLRFVDMDPRSRIEAAI